MNIESTLRAKYEALAPVLNERTRRIDTDGTLLSDLNALLEPVPAGRPDDSPLRWTSQSLRKVTARVAGSGPFGESSPRPRAVARARLHLAGEPQDQGRHAPPGSGRSVSLPHRPGAKGPGQPVISVDTKKKERVGAFKNAGRQGRPKGEPERVKVHDFVIPRPGKAIPYGVYDLRRNEGWVSVGIDPDTAHVAVNAIRSGGNTWADRPTGGAAPGDHGRCRGQQRPEAAPVEVGTSAVCRSHGSDGHGVPLSARHEQVEPHRASPVLLYRQELARPTSGQSGHGGQPDRPDDDAERASGACGNRPAMLSPRRRRQGRANGAYPPLAP